MPRSAGERERQVVRLYSADGLAEEVAMALCGRDDLAWDELARAGLEFLLERARLEKFTSCTELNATLIRRTGLPGFDFSRADERAAMGHLLYLIVELNRPETGLMISAPVSYLDANNAQRLLRVRAKTWECFSETPRPCESWSSGPDRSRGYMSTTRRSGQHERLRSLGGAWLSARPLLSQ
jgi:hypothetical protein